MGNVSAFAQNEHLVGRKVMTIKWDTEARKGNQVVRKLELAEVYEVTKVNGQWLWFNNSVGGWVKRSDVVPFEQAIDHFNRLVQQNPTRTNFYHRALAWKAKGELDIALGDLNEAIRRDPSASTYFNSRGNLWKAKGEYDRAIDDYNEAIRLDPSASTYFNSRGNLWKAKGEYDRAIADYNEAIRLDPKYAAAYNNRGVAWDDKGEHDRAIADYNEAIRLDPKYATAYNNRGYSWSNKGDYDRAIADYNEAIRLGPHVLVYLNRGNVSYSRGEYDRAIDDYNEAIRLKPKDARGYANRGLAWKKNGNYNMAITDYNEAISLDASNAVIHNLKAWLLATCPESKYRDGQKAVQHARKACESTKYQNDSYVCTLSAAHAAAGNIDEAKKWLKKAIELNPDSYKEIRDKMMAVYEAGKPYIEEPENVE